jgi:hypothetical protein
MKLGIPSLILIVAFFLGSCSTNNVSKIPHINLIAFTPDSIRVNLDTCFFVFSLTDGDGDLGNNPTSVIWLKDSRFDTGFSPIPFPLIDQTIEDPKKGLTGICAFYPLPLPVPRPDSLHMALGDTLIYEFYITDRANQSSNHIITHPLIIKPK